MLNRTYLLTLALLGGTCLAQTPQSAKEPPRFYKLDFVVKELDGTRVVNSRSYSTTASDEEHSGCAIRTGSKVPVGPPGASATTAVDVGVSIDCRSIKEVRNELSITVTADITSMAQDSTAAAAYPVIRQNRWSSTVVVPIKKPAVIFSSDDTTTKRQIQVELTATPIP
jgi:hypothetical protein